MLVFSALQKGPGHKMGVVIQESGFNRAWPKFVGKTTLLTLG